jgi:hypothetical protein
MAKLSAFRRFGLYCIVNSRMPNCRPAVVGSGG